jgi:hypothetical protein
MNITDALYRAVHAYPGGAESLAPRMRISASSLSQKVSPTYPGAHCSPDEMAAIMDLTGDHGALHALSARMGYMLLAAPEVAMGGEVFAERLATSVREFAEFIGTVTKDLADGQVSDNELREIERELLDMISAAQALHALAARLNQQRRPAPVRAAA